MGIELNQMADLEALQKDTPGYVPASADYDPANKTPNQQALSAAIALWIKDKSAVSQCASLFTRMAATGHQAVGTGYGDEQGAPDPHSGLWATALAAILYQADKQKNAALVSLAVAYWADHINMCRQFWTPAGVRVACARAIYTLAKGTATASPKPSWTCDSRIYALITGTPESRAKVALGNVAPPDQIAYDLLQACSYYFARIVAQSKTQTLKLAVPVRRWLAPDGSMVTALTADVPMNDRMSWCEVSAAGAITASSNTLANFVAPAGVPAVLGGSAQGAPPVVTSPTPAPAPTSAPAPASPVSAPPPVAPTATSSSKLPLILGSAGVVIAVLVILHFVGVL